MAGHDTHFPSCPVWLLCQAGNQFHMGAGAQCTGYSLSWSMSVACRIVIVAARGSATFLR